MNRVIAAFSQYTAPIVIERAGVGAYDPDTGNWVPGAATLIEVPQNQAAVVPAKASDLRNLPEGKEGKGAIFVYSDVEIKAVNKAALQQPDVILWDSRRWEVHVVDHMNHIPSLAHWMAMAIAEDA